MERYIVFIANITQKDTITVNCFLFEIKDGQQLQVQKGCFKEMKSESPFRLNAAVVDCVDSGAEKDCVGVGAENPNNEDGWQKPKNKEARKKGNKTDAKAQAQTEADTKIPTQKNGRTVIPNNMSKNQSIFPDAARNNTEGSAEKNPDQSKGTPLAIGNTDAISETPSSTGQRTNTENKTLRTYQITERTPLPAQALTNGGFAFKIEGRNKNDLNKELPQQQQQPEQKPKQKPEQKPKQQPKNLEQQQQHDGQQPPTKEKKKKKKAKKQDEQPEPEQQASWISRAIAQICIILLMWLLMYMTTTFNTGFN